MRNLFILIICCILASCRGRYRAHQTFLVVKSIHEPIFKGENNCYYYIAVIDGRNGIWDEFWYLAPVGKYVVGDTLNLEK